MDNSNSKVKIFIGAVFVILLQVFLSPIISINNVLPNFIVAFTISVIVARPDQQHLFFAFIMGLIYDFVTFGPVGSMAFVLLAVTFILSKILVRIEELNTAINVLAIVLSLLIIETVYGAFQVSLILDASFVEMLVYRAFPCGVYDIIICLVFFPIMVKLLQPVVVNASYAPNIDQSRW